MDLSTFVKPETPRPLIIYPDEKLFIHSIYCNGSAYEKQKAIDIMFTLLYKYKGIGLSAPQVDLECSLFVLNASGNPGQVAKQAYFINPEILYVSEHSVKLEEKCLSLPGCSVYCRRPKQVTVRYENVKGDKITKILDGAEARIFQHEYEHLFGKTILDFIGIK